jgi:hypothetical protein
VNAFCYALGEFIDNAISATHSNTRGRDRQIQVLFCCDKSPNKKDKDKVSLVSFTTLTVLFLLFSWLTVVIML